MPICCNWQYVWLCSVQVQTRVLIWLSICCCFVRRFGDLQAVDFQRSEDSSNSCFFIGAIGEEEGFCPASCVARIISTNRHAVDCCDREATTPTPYVAGNVWYWRVYPWGSITIFHTSNWNMIIQLFKLSINIRFSPGRLRIHFWKCKCKIRKFWIGFSLGNPHGNPQSMFCEKWNFEM